MKSHNKTVVKKGKQKMADFDRLNRETRDFNNRNVDRFNRSTSGNYNYFDPYKLNNSTYRQNNGTYSSYYSNK